MPYNGWGIYGLMGGAFRVWLWLKWVGQSVPPTGGGNRGSLPRAPSVRGPPNNAELVQILAVSDRKVRRTGPQLYSGGLHSSYVR